MSTTPLVSVIIPVYNAAHTIADTVKSLMQGSYHNLEVILVDDGSQDNSFQVCQQLVKKYNNSKTSIKAFHQPNAGASSARNLGLKKASGELICFVDSDDLVQPEFISTLVKLMQQPKTALAGTGMLRQRVDKKSRPQNLYCNHLRAQEPHEPRQDYILWLMLQDGRLYPVANKIFHADIIRQNHLQFNTAITFAEDTEFVLSYLKHAPGAIRFDPTPLYIYQINRSTGTVGQASLDWQNWQKSYNFVKTWLHDPTPKTRRLLVLLKLRWHISHILAHLRS